MAIESQSARSKVDWLKRQFACSPTFVNNIFLSLILIAMTVWLYFPVNGHPYFGPDDRLYVVFNPHVHEGLTWNTVVWAFRSHYINWIPLTWLSHALDFQMFGIYPAGSHLMNVALHALNAALVFWVLRRVTGYTGRSFMVAPLFALHPINVEPVAWIAERKTILSTTFFLLSLGSYNTYVSKPTNTRYWLVAGSFILALLAKPQVIALPLLLLLWDYWPLQRLSPTLATAGAATKAMEKLEGKSISQLLNEKFPLFAFAAADAIMTLEAQGVAHRGSQAYPLSIRIGNAIVSYVRYVGKAIWPAWLAPHYPHPGATLTGLVVAAALLGLFAITAFVVVMRQHPYLLVGWFWFLITMVPMIGIVQVGKQGMADRYAYQPFIGLYLMICWGTAELAQARHIPVSVVCTASIAVLVPLALAARRQVDYWHDDLTLWTHAVRVTKNNALAEYSVGNALIAAGRPAEAMPFLYKSFALDPQDPWTNLQIGRYQLQQGDFALALGSFQRVIASPYQDLEASAPAYYGMASAYGAMNDRSHALECQSKGDKAEASMRVP